MPCLGEVNPVGKHGYCFFDLPNGIPGFGRAFVRFR